MGASGTSRAPRQPRLLVFAKAPIPGRTFTRLIPVLGPRGAAALHMQLTAEALRRLVHPGRWYTRLYGTPDTGDPFLQACARRHGIPLRPQRGRGLGERMHSALAEACASGGPAVLVGTDLPDQGASDVAAALAALAKGREAVFQPTEDGGFGLVGFNRPLPGLFIGIPWSTPEVMTTIRERLCGMGADWAELSETWDVDRREDLFRLAAGQWHTPFENIRVDALPPAGRDVHSSSNNGPK